MALCIGGGARCSPDSLIELIEIDTGGSGGRSAPGLYGLGGASAVCGLGWRRYGKTSEVEALPDGRCSDCGSEFSDDLAVKGYVRHLVRLPKLDRETGDVLRNADGEIIYCGGTNVAWGLGGRDNYV